MRNNHGASASADQALVASQSSRQGVSTEGFDPSRMSALERLMEGEPPHPKGTVVREIQDELAAWRNSKEKREDGRDIGRPVPIHASGGGAVDNCAMCGTSYALHDRNKDNWLACPSELFERLESITWSVQGQSAAPSNLLDWLLADNRYPQHRGRSAAIGLIAELWWRAGGAGA